MFRQRHFEFFFFILNNSGLKNHLTIKNGLICAFLPSNHLEALFNSCHFSYEPDFPLSNLCILGSSTIPQIPVENKHPYYCSRHLTSMQMQLYWVHCSKRMNCVLMISVHIFKVFSFIEWLLITSL